MLSRRTPSFAFIVHPRSVADLDLHAPTSFLRRYSESEEDYVHKVLSLKVLTLGEVVFGIGPFFGELIAALWMPEDWGAAKAVQLVREGVTVAANHGASVVGLGGLTAPASGGGGRLLSTLPHGVTLTNGNAYTAHVVYENVVDALNILGLSRSLATIGVVGCTGSVGTAATHLLAEAEFKLLLVGRSPERVEQKFRGLDNAEFTASLPDLRRADIIVLLTSDPSAALTADHCRPDTVVIDCAQPANITPDRAELLHAAGILVFEGGVVRIPNYSSTYDFGLAAGDEAFACLAETYLFARFGVRDHSTGAPPVALSRRMSRLALAEGIEARPLCLDAVSGRRPALLTV